MITERVDASVDFKFPGMSGSCSIKQLEEYIFNARMRGAEDDSMVTFVTKAGSSMYGPGYTSGMSVAVQATMGGFPVVPQEPKVATRTKARVIAASLVALPLVVVYLLLWLMF